MSDYQNEADPFILKLVIRDQLEDLQASGGKSLITYINNLRERGLVDFKDAYADFIAGVVSSADSLDQWISLQMSLLSDLGAARNDVIQGFVKLFNLSLKCAGELGTEGALPDWVDKGGHSIVIGDSSMIVAAIVRTYGNMPSVVGPIRAVEPDEAVKA